MCERYVLPDQFAAEREFLPSTAWWRFAPRFNVAIGQYVPAIRMHEGQSEGVMMRWGLIPSWAEGMPTREPAAGVEPDRIEHSEIFGPPWRSGQRCILPVSGFYLWRLTSGGYRQPFFVRLVDRHVFAVAGIWDRSESEDGDVIESCSMICVAPNELVAHTAHPQRHMPAILRRRDYETWLRGTSAQARGTLQSYRPDWMQAHAISPRINSLVHEDPGLIRPTTESAPAAVGNN